MCSLLRFTAFALTISCLVAIILSLRFSGYDTPRWSFVGGVIGAISSVSYVVFADVLCVPSCLLSVNVPVGCGHVRLLAFQTRERFIRHPVILPCFV